MNKNLTLYVTIVVLAAGVLARAAGDLHAAEEQERALIDILQSDAPAAEKAITCKRLAVYGTSNAVGALAPLLTDGRLASWARIALEAIPGPEADGALRKAMGTLKGRSLVGVINSIGVRRDQQAVVALAKMLQGEDSEVASAAAVALGRIGNAPAAETLRQSLTSAPINVRSAVAEGCILCAERSLDEGKPNQAIEIYDAVREAELPEERILEATRGAILARRSDGIPLLVEQLRSADRRRFQMALSTARQLAGSDVIDALAAELDRATPERRALLLRVFASRDDMAALPVVLQAAKAGPAQVRIAAIGVLGHMGDASCVPTLLEIAAMSEADLANSAQTALAKLPGENVDSELAARLSEADGEMLVRLIQLVGERRIDATPALLKTLDHRNAQIRSVALTALGETVGADNLSILISRVAAPEHPEDTPAAQEALRAACIRMPDGEQCAQQLVAKMAECSVPSRLRFLEVLGAMGGNNALEAMAAAAKDGDPQFQDLSTRLLGEWMTVDAAPVLLDLAKAAPEEKYQIRALRGYLRLARQFNMPNLQRAEMCRNALEVAQRADEQKLALQVIERYPSIEMLSVVVKAADMPALKDDATRIALAIAGQLDHDAADVQQLLAQIGQDPATE